jgi:hypothetical protein
VILELYCFKPRKSVDKPVPPPIATIFGGNGDDDGCVGDRLIPPMRPVVVLL